MILQHESSETRSNIAQKELTVLKLFGDLICPLLKLKFPDSILLFGLYAHTEKKNSNLGMNGKLHKNRLKIHLTHY